jgi:hypothetical protein
MFQNKVGLSKLTTCTENTVLSSISKKDRLWMKKGESWLTNEKIGSGSESIRCQVNVLDRAFLEISESAQNWLIFIKIAAGHRSTPCVHWDIAISHFLFHSGKRKNRKSSRSQIFTKIAKILFERQDERSHSTKGLGTEIILERARAIAWGRLITQPLYVMSWTAAAWTIRLKADLVLPNQIPAQSQQSRTGLIFEQKPQTHEKSEKAP